MTTYINIGASCSTFTGETAPLGYSSVYIINASNAPLNPSAAATASGFPVLTGTSNTLAYSSIAFNMYFDERLIRFTTGRQNWRYIGTSAPSYSETGTARFQTIVASSWPASFTGASTLAVTHPAQGGTSYTMVTGTHTGLQTWIKDTYLALPSLPGNPQPTTTTKLYLYQNTNNAVYLSGTSGSLTTVTPNSPSGRPATAYYFSYDIVSGVRITIGISSTSGGSGAFLTGVRYDSPTSVNVSGTTYTITTTEPAVGENPAGFPASESTLLKHVSSGKYVYWNGFAPSVGSGSTIIPTTVYTSTSAPSLSLIDYWQSGISSSQIMQGLQFKFWDLTGTTSATSPDSTIKDWYGWLVVRDVSKAPAFNNTINVAVTNDNTLYIGAGTAGGGKGYGPVSGTSRQNPNNFEGWVLVGSSASQQIVYVRNPTEPPSGSPTPVGYLTSLDGTQITFAPLSTLPIPSTSNNFQCFKCTGLSGANSYCNPVSPGGAITPAINLGSFSTTSWYLQNSNTLVMPMTNIVATATTPITQSITSQTLNPDTVRTLYTGNSTIELLYVLNGSGVYINGQSYTINLSTTALAVSQQISTTITIPSTVLGSITGVVSNSSTGSNQITISSATIPIGTRVRFSILVVASGYSLTFDVVTTITDQPIFNHTQSFFFGGLVPGQTLRIHAFTPDNKDIYPTNTVTYQLSA